MLYFFYLWSFLKTLFSPNKPLDVDPTLVGINFDINDNRYIKTIHNSLGITVIRLKFEWTDFVHSDINIPVNFNKFDNIIANLPEGIHVLILIDGCPLWPQYSFQKHEYFIKFIREVAIHFNKEKKVFGYQIGHNADPDYLDLLKDAYNIIKSINHNKLVTNHYILSIKNLRILKKLFKKGLLSYVDVFSFEYAETSNWNLLKPLGLVHFLQSIKKPIYITELSNKVSGFHVSLLLKHLPRIQRIFWNY